jgi:hypothetical protein
LFTSLRASARCFHSGFFISHCTSCLFPAPFLVDVCLRRERHQPKHAAAAVEHYLAIWCSGDLLMPRHDAKFITPRSPATTFNSTQRAQLERRGLCCCCRSRCLAFTPAAGVPSGKLQSARPSQCTLLYAYWGLYR